MTTRAFPIPGTGQVPLVEHRRDLHDTIVGILLVIFLVFFFVGAKLESLPIPGRVEDLVFLMLLPFGYRYVLRPKTRLFWWIVAYFAVNLVPYVSEYLAGAYTLGRYPIILMKEIEYFYIAFLICQQRAWWVLRTVDALALLIVGNGVRALLAGEISYYGIGTFGTVAPSLSGALYLFSTIWIHVRSKLLPLAAWRVGALIPVLLGAVCVVATVSRSSILALFVYITVYLLLARIAGFPPFLLALGLTPKIIQAVALSMSAGMGLIATRIVRRAGTEALERGTERTGKWMNYLRGLEPIDFVFGKGTGYPNALDGTLTLGVDSQYVRLTMERGILGFIIVFMIIWTLLMEIKRRGGEYQHAWAIVIAMLVLSIPLEALQVSKSGSFFWLLMFYLLMVQRRPSHPAPPATARAAT